MIDLTGVRPGVAVQVARWLPEGKSGHVSITRITADENAATWSLFTDGHRAIQAGEYTQLRRGGQLWMSDTPAERREMQGFLLAARGHVLMVGLGIGLCLPPLLANHSVTGVVVVELDPDVIALVAPHYEHPKLQVRQGDIMTWRPQPGEKFDTIWFDIWPDLSTDNLEQMRLLHQRGKLWKASPESYMESWERRLLKAMRRQEQRWERQLMWLRR